MVKDGLNLSHLTARANMLIGSYLAVLSDSRRTAVPKKFLRELGDNPVIAKWYEECLIIVPNNFWERLSGKLTGGRKTLDLGLRDIERFILGSAYELEPDEQGRIIIPEILAEFAGLSKDLVFVGLIDRVEIWPKDKWESKSREIARTSRDYIENLNKNENR